MSLAESVIQSEMLSSARIRSAMSDRGLLPQVPLTLKEVAEKLYMVANPVSSILMANTVRLPELPPSVVPFRVSPALECVHHSLLR